MQSNFQNIKYGINSILAFLPPTKEGNSILNEALYFQQKLEMRMFILNIIKSPSLLSKTFQTKKIIRLKNEARNNLHHFVSSVIKGEIPNNLILRIKIGEIVTTLINESKKGGYNFIIVDKGSFSTGLHRKKIDQFVSRSYCPVLTINNNFPLQQIKKIIVPIDISQSTKKRLLWASLFAKTFNAKVQIVSALNVNLKESKSLAFKNAEKLKHILLNQNIACEVKILKVHKQKNHKVILDYIEEEKPELVIIRTHQESIFSGTNIGEFVSAIVHGCKMPVFSVNYSKEPDELIPR